MSGTHKHQGIPVHGAITSPVKQTEMQLSQSQAEKEYLVLLYTDVIHLTLMHILVPVMLALNVILNVEILL